MATNTIVKPRTLQQKAPITSDTTIYNINDLERTLYLKARTIREMLNNGELQGYKKKNRWYVLHLDLVRWIRTK